MINGSIKHLISLSFSYEIPFAERIRYLSLFAMTLIILLWPANEVFIFRKFGELTGYIRSIINFSSFRNGMKEKNEDENCEYETIWDAEGNMHLIRKASQAPKTYSDERILTER